MATKGSGASKGQFQQGNQMWKARTSVGVGALFTEPEQMWKAACEYFDWCEQNPLWMHDIKVADKELTEVSVPKARPFTITGLCLFWGVNSVYLANFKRNEVYANNPDFSKVISDIEETIRTQKFEGAASGFFNANIISRDLGLADKTEIRGNIISDPDEPVTFE